MGEIIDTMVTRRQAQAALAAARRAVPEEFVLPAVLEKAPDAVARRQQQVQTAGERFAALVRGRPVLPDLSFEIPAIGGSHTAYEAIAVDTVAGETVFVLPHEMTHESGGMTVDTISLSVHTTDPAGVAAFHELDTIGSAVMQVGPALPSVTDSAVYNNFTKFADLLAEVSPSLTS